MGDSEPPSGGEGSIVPFECYDRDSDSDSAISGYSQCPAIHQLPSPWGVAKQFYYRMDDDISDRPKMRLHHGWGLERKLDPQNSSNQHRIQTSVRGAMRHLRVNG